MHFGGISMEILEPVSRGLSQAGSMPCHTAPHSPNHGHTAFTGENRERRDRNRKTSVPPLSPVELKLTAETQRRRRLTAKNAKNTKLCELKIQNLKLKID
jgi:hypothetical protein